MTLHILCWLLFPWGTSPNVEQAKTDFAKANQTYASDKYSLSMTYHYYYEHASTTPDETKTGLYYKNGAESYSNLMGIESIRNKNMSLVIQKEEKIIVVGNAVKAEKAMSLNLDTLLGLCAVVNRSEPGAGLVKYELVFKPSTIIEFEKIDVYLDMKGAYVTKLVLYYKEQEIPKDEDPSQWRKIHPKLEILYKNFTRNYAANAALFNDANYVVKISGNKYKATAKYAGYQVYNQKFK